MRLKRFGVISTAIGVLWGVAILLGAKYGHKSAFWVGLTKVFIGFIVICLIIDLVLGVKEIINSRKVKH